MVQRAAFPKEIRHLKESNVRGQTSGERTVTHENKAMKKASSLYQLDPFLDASGVLRVGGRIKRSSLSYGVIETKRIVLYYFVTLRDFRLS